MTVLSKDDVKAISKAVDPDIQDPDLSGITGFLTAIVEAVDDTNPPGFESVEPLLIILPKEVS